MALDYVLHHWPPMGGEEQKDLQPYWSFRDEISIIDRIVMKFKRTLLPVSLKKGAEPAAHEQYGSRTGKAAGKQIHLLDQHEI